MKAATRHSADIHFDDIHRRFVNSSEWDRIRAILVSKSNEAGWIDDLRSKSKERARIMEPLSFRKLLEEFGPNAQSSMPVTVQREVRTLIKQFVEKQWDV